MLVSLLLIEYLIKFLIYSRKLLLNRYLTIFIGYICLVIFTAYAFVDYEDRRDAEVNNFVDSKLDNVHFSIRGRRTFYTIISR